MTSPYQPIFEFTRGKIVESIHAGAIAVVDACGELLAWHGDPTVTTFLRSTAKPFQAMPFLERGGQAFYALTPKEIALMCASHSGTDEHVQVVRGIQAKTGVQETDLLCGTHPPYDQSTQEALRERKEAVTSNRHNCSGKHTGMLAYTHMLAQQRGAPLSDLPYIAFEHPIQKEIMQTFAEMCDVQPAQIEVGIDGCSAPNFAVPLRNAAHGFARLCDPGTGGVQPRQRREACRTLTAAMTAHPEMVGGPGRFDTELMRIAGGRVMTKTGAEGYQGVGLMPGVLSADSPGVGIAVKIGDGDVRGTVRCAVVLEILRQLGVLSETELAALKKYGPRIPVYNWRKLEVGEGRPCFELTRH